METNELLSTRQIEVFVAIVEQKSFTRAAQQVGLSQSTVSGHVADLERRLGTTLIERDRSGVRLTPAGTALLPSAREMLRAERAARQAVEDLAGLAGGRLVIGASTIPATHLLPSLFSTFHAQFPAVSLRLVAGDSAEILDRILLAEIEVGIVGARPDPAELTSHAVGEDRLVLVAAPDHPLAGRKKVTVDDLFETGVVMREPGSGSRAEAERALGLDEPIRAVCEMGSTESVRAAARAGLGAAFLSELAVDEDLASGKLVALSLDGFDSRRTFYLAHRTSARLSPAARAFVELARNR